MKTIPIDMQSSAKLLSSMMPLRKSDPITIMTNSGNAYYCSKVLGSPNSMAWHQPPKGPEPAIFCCL